MVFSSIEAQAEAARAQQARAANFSTGRCATCCPGCAGTGDRARRRRRTRRFRCDRCRCRGRSKRSDRRTQARPALTPTMKPAKDRDRKPPTRRTRSPNAQLSPVVSPSSLPCPRPAQRDQLLVTRLTLRYSRSVQPAWFAMQRSEAPNLALEDPDFLRARLPSGEVTAVSVCRPGDEQRLRSGIGPGPDALVEFAPRRALSGLAFVNIPSGKYLPGKYSNAVAVLPSGKTTCPFSSTAAPGHDDQPRCRNAPGV